VPPQIVQTLAREVFSAPHRSQILGGWVAMPGQ
jgi:hypothetical protein